jgi:hypothetical protein
MKRILIVILSILLIYITSISVFAISDKTPPDIISISTNTKSLFGGDKIKFTIKGDDDLSGLGSVMIEYHLKSNNKQRLSVILENNTSSNTFTGPYKVPEKTFPGKWEVFAIQAWDNAGNLQTYHTSDVFDFDTIGFTVNESNIDTTPPILKSIKVKNKVINAPGKIEVIAVATDNKSSNVKVHVTYLISGVQHSIQLSKTSGNTYTGSLNVDEGAKFQPVKLGYIVVEDEAGNAAWYSYNPDEYPFGDVSLKLDTNIDVSFSNTVSDTNAPKLSSYRYSSSKISVPGTVSIIFNAKDDVSGIASIKAHFIGLDKNNSQIEYFILFPEYDRGTKSFISNFTFDQYFPDCTFSITKIELEDNAGNQSIYSTEPQSGEKPLEVKTLTLTKAIEGDIAVGTMKDDYTEKIKDAKDNDVIMIDCSNNHIVKGEVFDTIRGSNKTLILVNDGIQWLFKGADITRKSKDINTKIKISKLDDSGNEIMLDCFTENNNGLVIEFSPNGILPGKSLIKIKADYTFRNYVGVKDLYIYHFQESEGNLEAIADRIEMSKGGYYEFYINHNSKYIISSRKAKTVSIVKDSTNLNKKLNGDENTEEDQVAKTEPINSIENNQPKENTVKIESTQGNLDNGKKLETNRLALYIILSTLIICFIAFAYFSEPIKFKLKSILKK